MKRFILFTVILFTTSLTNAQKLELDQKTVNLDTVAVKSKNVFEVKYRNTGDKPLVLKNIISDCKCVRIKWNKSPIMAGDSSKIEVTFTPTSSGVFYKSIFFAPISADSLETLVLRGVVR